jgi:hypothetical protein
LCLALVRFNGGPVLFSSENEPWRSVPCGPMDRTGPDRLGLDPNPSRTRLLTRTWPAHPRPGKWRRTTQIWVKTDIRRESSKQNSETENQSQYLRTASYQFRTADRVTQDQSVIMIFCGPHGSSVGRMDLLWAEVRRVVLA